MLNENHDVAVVLRGHSTGTKCSVPMAFARCRVDREDLAGRDEPTWPSSSGSMQTGSSARSSDHCPTDPKASRALDSKEPLTQDDDGDEQRPCVPANVRSSADW